MGYCKDCKHWYIASGHTHWNTCEAVDSAEHDEKIPEDGFALYADALDDSGLESGLKTGPLFGCLKFQPKLQLG